MGGDGKLFEVNEYSMICSCQYDTPAYTKARELWDRVRKSTTLESILVMKKEEQK
jgi:hypothetical protein